MNYKWLIFFLLYLLSIAMANPNKRRVPVLELGQVIRESNPETSVKPVFEVILGNGLVMKDKDLTINFSQNTLIPKLTTISHMSNSTGSISSQKCLPVTIVHAISELNETSLPTIKKTFISRYGLVLILGAANITKISETTLRYLENQNAIIGSFADSPLNTTLLMYHDIHVLSNLMRPNELKAELSYTGYLFVFDIHRDKIECLANLVMIEDSDDFNFCNSNSGHVVDLGHSHYGRIPLYPGTDYPSLENKTLNFIDHYGSHIDMPFHLIHTAESSEFFMKELLVPCLKVQYIDFTIDNQMVNESAFVQWEKEAGRTIPEGSFVMVDTGYNKYWEAPDKYNKMTESGKAAFPGFKSESVEWLVENRKVIGIAIDSTSTDPANSTDFKTHITVAKRRIIGFENIGNLNNFPDAKGHLQIDGKYGPQSSKADPVAKCLLVFLRSSNGTGAPSSVFAHISLV